MDSFEDWRLGDIDKQQEQEMLNLHLTDIATGLKNFEESRCNSFQNRTPKDSQISKLFLICMRFIILKTWQHEKAYSPPSPSRKNY